MIDVKDTTEEATVLGCPDCKSPLIVNEAIKNRKYCLKCKVLWAIYDEQSSFNRSFKRVNDLERVDAVGK
jgi:transcription initiation factor IIE alpha subunit